ncbi:MAG: penicillin-binding protein 2 [Anaerolineales bacterium]
MLFRNRLWIGFILFLAACTPTALLSTPSAPPASAIPQNTLPPSTETPPDPQLVARAYLDAWKIEDYLSMYAWLSPLSQDSVLLDDFTSLHQGLAAIMSLNGLEYEITSVFSQAASAQVAYRVQFNTILVGVIEREMVMNLTLENNLWRVQWTRTMILPELTGENTLTMQVRAPARGNIYDRNGHALVAQAEAVSLGLVVGETDPAQEADLFYTLWSLTGLEPDEITEKIAAAKQGWYVPLGEVAAEPIAAQFDYLSSFEGLVMEPYRSRYYFEGGIAPQLLGYVSQIQPDEVETYQRLGYQQDERVGRTGLEAWAETSLAGGHGGTLYVITPDGQIVTKLAETEPQPAHSLYTTLDRDLQLGAQQALEGFLGAIVVLERDTGRVLALASSPTFDPNIFEPTNYNSGFLLDELLNNPDTPLLNRATQGQYPLGSVFKLITAAAGMESGLYSPESTYFCAQTFNEIPGVTRYDWTYAWGVPPSGLLTLPEGIMRSCNPWFWHIGLDLFTQGLQTTLSDLATGFGLGQPTGIGGGVVEATGNVPVPKSEIDAINNAIGQGDTLVTPLQVARFVAAIGNGGDLLLPQVVERFETPDGKPVEAFKPVIQGQLPISPATLAMLQEGMQLVTNDPRGTAYWLFINFPAQIAGKTGTAEAPPGDPHAWFAGYTYNETGDKPDIAVAVVLEHAGEGSRVAAPIFKRILEIYYFGAPVSLLPWEAGTELPPP